MKEVMERRILSAFECLLFAKKSVAGKHLTSPCNKNVPQLPFPDP